jgi:hypothetical protein
MSFTMIPPREKTYFILKFCHRSLLSVDILFVLISFLICADFVLEDIFLIMLFIDITVVVRHSEF